MQYVFANDKTAIFLDVREPDEFARDSVPNTKNLPGKGVEPGKKDVGELRKAKNDGRLPYEDHNTRIIVFGDNGAQAYRLAEALTLEGFHNVAYFNGTFAECKAALQ
jgi:rhodanese-related sulfurtransferase